jgi:hypothetical protein
MPLIAEDTDNLRREGLIQEPYHGFPIGTVPCGHSPLFDMLTRPCTEGLNISYKWLVSHTLSSL